MKLSFTVFLCFILAAASAVFAQQSRPSPTPAPGPSPPSPRPKTVNPNLPGSVESGRMSQFSVGSTTEADPVSSRVIYLQRYVAPMYRKATSDELKMLEPSSAVRDRYAEFLRLEDTGIVRLIPDHGCATNDRVVSAKDDCIKYSMPGAGSSYSFRVETYRLPQLSDITYDGTKFTIFGQFMNGMLADIGKLPIEDVTSASPGVPYAFALAPVKEFEAAITLDRELRMGVEKDGFVYAKSAASVEGSTYILRNIAYRGRVTRAISGIPYNELDFDKRRDVVVVFKVAAVDPDGSVTIVWRKLSEDDAPKLKPPKEPENDKEAGNNL